MAKSKLLPEFPSDWHQEAFVRDLERELLGRQRRKQELIDMGGDLAEVDSEIEAVYKELKRLGAPSQRPRKAEEAAA